MGTRNLTYKVVISPEDDGMVLGLNELTTTRQLLFIVGVLVVILYTKLHLLPVFEWYWTALTL